MAEPTQKPYLVAFGWVKLVKVWFVARSGPPLRTGMSPMEKSALTRYGSKTRTFVTVRLWNEFRNLAVKMPAAAFSRGSPRGAALSYSTSQSRTIVPKAGYCAPGGLPPLSFPATLVYGRADEFYAYGLGLTSCYDSPVVFEHEEGHRFPSDRKFNAGLREHLREALLTTDA